MNNSERTTIIARGICHWAERQNMTNATVEGSWPDRKWKEWAARYPQFVEFVKAEQFRLFDRVNAAF